MGKDSSSADTKVIKDYAGVHSDRPLSEQGTSGGDTQDEGCACSTTTTTPGWLLGLLLLAGLAVRRRRS